MTRRAPALSTWLTIVARSTARDALRRRRADSVPIEAVPEARLAIDPVEPVRKLKLPEALLSPRQREILAMLYDRDMDVAEIAARARDRPADRAQRASQGDDQAAGSLQGRRGMTSTAPSNFAAISLVLHLRKVAGMAAMLFT